jgi:hypothetical protein
MKVKMTQEDRTVAREFRDEFGVREPLDAPDESGGREPTWEIPGRSL